MAKKIGKFLDFLRKKIAIAPGPSRRFLGRRDFLSFGNVKFLINSKVFAYFRLINHIKPAKHTRQLTYQDPSFQWLKVLLLGVEKWRLKLEFFWVFLRKNYAYFDIPICICLCHFQTNHCSEAIRKLLPLITFLTM